MLIVPLRCPQDILNLEIEVQKSCVALGVVGVVLQPVLQRGCQCPQRRQQGRGQFFAEHRAVLRIVGGRQRERGRLRLFQKRGLAAAVLSGGSAAPPGREGADGFPALQKGFVGLGEGRFKSTPAPAEGALGLGKAALAKAGGVHGAGTLGQVVGLIHEEEPVARAVKEPPQVHHWVEEVVVVPDDDVTPLAQVQPQLEGADRELPRGIGQRGPVEAAAALVQKGSQGGVHPVVVAVGVGTKLGQTGGMALGVRVEADLLLGRQGHAPERQPRGSRPQPRHGVLGGRLRGIAGREVEQLLAAAGADGPQGGEEDAHGLADAGGGLTEEPDARLRGCSGAGAVDLACQRPLPGPIGRKREGQRREALAPALLPRQLALRPRGVLPEKVLQEGFQLPEGEMPQEAEDFIGIDLIVCEPDVQPVQPLLTAIERPVDHPLCPVAGVHVLGDGVGRDGGGLDLVDDRHPCLVGKDAVSPPLDGEGDARHFPLTGEENFGGIALARRLLQPAVDARALVGAVKAGEAAVDAAGAEQKFYQLTDRQTKRGHRGHFLLFIIKLPQPQYLGALDGGCVHPVEVYGGAVVGLKLIMTGLGLRHQVGSLLKKLGGGPLVEAETGAVARQILPVHEAGAPDGLHTGQLDGMPPVVGEESQPEGRDEEMVDLVLGMHGAGAGDDVVAPGQRLGPDKLQQQPGDGPAVVVEDHIPVGQRLHRPPVEHRAFGGDGRQQPQLLAGLGSVGQAGEEPGTEPLDVPTHLFEVGAAGLGPAAVQQQASCRGDIPCGPAAEGGILGKEVLHLIGVGAEGGGVQRVVQAYHLLFCARGVRLQNVGRSGVHDGSALVEEDDAVQTVGVAGAVDALDGLALLLGLEGQPLHQSRFAAARPAFDEIHLHPRFPPQRLKIPFEPGGGGGP